MDQCDIIFIHACPTSAAIYYHLQLYDSHCLFCPHSIQVTARELGRNLLHILDSVSFFFYCDHSLSQQSVFCHPRIGLLTTYFVAGDKKAGGSFSCTFGCNTNSRFVEVPQITPTFYTRRATFTSRHSVSAATMGWVGGFVWTAAS